MHHMKSKLRRLLALLMVFALIVAVKRTPRPVDGPVLEASKSATAASASPGDAAPERLPDDEIGVPASRSKQFSRLRVSRP